jgi:phosphoribosylanthranilate isomerase
MTSPEHLSMRPRIKICGLTRDIDVSQAVHLGVDAIGFVLYAASPRAITVERAAKLSAILPPFVSPVLLFVNPNQAEVEQALCLIPNAILQFHGEESPAFCESFQHPYLRAARIPVDSSQPALDLIAFASAHPRALGILLDSHSTHYGGSGKTFHWQSLPRLIPAHLVLGGGLTPENVVQGIEVVRGRGLSLAVDVSSGVESAKGLKDVVKMTRFVGAVRSTYS